MLTPLSLLQELSVTQLPSVVLVKDGAEVHRITSEGLCWRYFWYQQDVRRHAYGSYNDLKAP